MEMGEGVKEQFKKERWVRGGWGGRSWGEISGLSCALATVERKGRRLFRLSSSGAGAVSRDGEGGVQCWTS